MSGFLKRDTRTVNPAGGINPAQEPNVGQYGWTKYDAANINQIIEYVDLCKKYMEQTKESAEYVEGKVGELQDFIDYITEIYKEIGPIFANIEIIYKDIVAKHTDVVNMHSNILLVQTDVTASKDAAKASEDAAAAEAVKAATEATRAATEADESEQYMIQAAASAAEAKDIAEELRKGQVYRGTWNIEENAGYPTAPDTNSVWDITLKEGNTVGYTTTDGTLWYWGDRLLYIKDDNKFSQIESGSTVISVNGKAGAVTLSSADVGAVSLTGNSTIAGNLTATQLITTSTSGHGIRLTEASGSLYFQGGKTDRDITDQKMIMSGWYGTPLSFYRIVLAEGKHAYIQQGSTDYRMYHQGFKPTAVDVGAVGVTGPQTMTGTLSGVQFKASDRYAFTSSIRQYQGMYMGGTAGDPRTIIGGGGDVAGEPKGAVHIRPNGITDTSGETVFTAFGPVSNSVAPSAANHLTNKYYVDTTVKVVNDRIDAIKPLDLGAMPVAGGTFTGGVRLKDGLPGALKVNNQASISYQHEANSVIHNFAYGNQMHWAHGINAENTMAILGIDGSFETKGPQYAAVAQVAQNKDKNNWIGIEAPSSGAPYLSSKTTEEGQNVVAMRFGRSEISVESGKRFASNTFRVADDAGLKFSPANDLSGYTWGLGVNPTTRNLGLHSYDSGTWKGTTVEFSPTGNASYFGGNIFTTGSINANGGYITATRASNPMLELHSPGVTAGIIYLPGTGRMRFSQSNGAGGEAAMYAELQNQFAHFVGSVRPDVRSASWGQWGDPVGGIQDNTGNRTINPGQWHPMITSASYVDPAQGYAGRWSMGYYRPAAQHNGEVVINLNGDGMIRNNLRLVISGAGGGGLRMDGTDAGQTWAIQEGGFLYGSSFGAYANMVNWCTASFAPISDEGLKRNIKPATKSALDDVAQIEFKSYEWNEDAKVANMEPTKIGLVAQEMEAIDPAYTRDIQTFNPDGSVDTSVKGLDVTNMLALALKAIQEQQVQINELKEKLNEFILK